MNTLRENLKTNVSDIAYLFSSDSAVQEFQLQIQRVFAPTELFCIWFDDTYMPKDKDFIAAFTPSEHQAISTFNNSLEKLILEAGDPPLPLEDLCHLPSWSEVKLRANNVLEKLNASPINRAGRANERA